jgi:hypothetical protein
MAGLQKNPLFQFKDKNAFPEKLLCGRRLIGNRKSEIGSLPDQLAPMKSENLGGLYHLILSNFKKPDTTIRIEERVYSNFYSDSLRDFFAVPSVTLFFGVSSILQSFNPCTIHGFSTSSFLKSPALTTQNCAGRIYLRKTPLTSSRVSARIFLSSIS